MDPRMIRRLPRVSEFSLLWTENLEVPAPCRDFFSRRLVDPTINAQAGPSSRLPAQPSASAKSRSTARLAVGSSWAF
jgi:hypothetical protein